MPEIKIIRDSISLKELQEIANERFGDMVKAVVDVEKEIISLGGEMHADEEAIMLENGSKQEDLWGINLYPDDFGNEDFIEFDSMINIRPRQNNRSRNVDDEELRNKIVGIVIKLINE